MLNYYLKNFVDKLAEPGEARGCFTNTFVIYSLPNGLSHSLVKISIQRRHALMVEDGAFSNKKDYITVFFLENPSLEGHLNCLEKQKDTSSQGLMTTVVTL